MKFLINKKIEDAVNEWLQFKEISVKKSTFYKYQYMINKYILSYFKNKRISYFINYDFSKYVSQLSKDLSNKSIGSILTLFKSILRYIEKRYNINYKLDLISIPKQNQNEVGTLEESEVQQLENYCLQSNDFKEIGIAMCLLTGMRLGEICALKWKNIDLKNKLIYIKESVQRVYEGKNKSNLVTDSPKTLHSIRAIPIADKLLELLNNLYNTNNFIGEDYFLTGNEKFVDPRSYQRFFKKCLNICNIKNYKFHTLRHTFATNCIRTGMDIKSVSVILGHSNVKMTLNRYVHSSFYVQKEYLNKL